MNLFNWLKPKYLGYVELETYLVGDDGVRVPGGGYFGRFLLKLGPFGRSYSYSGADLVFMGSKFSQRGISEVKAWKLGGPLPTDFVPDNPIPEPSPKVVIKQGNVLGFPGKAGE